jgi:hypothetical protein
MLPSLTLLMEVHFVRKTFKVLKNPAVRKTDNLYLTQCFSTVMTTGLILTDFHYLIELVY